MPLDRKSTHKSIRRKQITIKLNKTTIYEGVHDGNTDKTKIDALAVDEANLAEDDYIHENVIVDVNGNGNPQQS